MGQVISRTKWPAALQSSRSGFNRSSKFYPAFVGSGGYVSTVRKVSLEIAFFKPTAEDLRLKSRESRSILEDYIKRASGQIAKSIDRVVRIEFDLAFGAGGRAHSRLRALGADQGSVNFVARWHRENGKHNFFVGACVLRADNLEAFHLQACPVEFAVSGFGLLRARQTIHGGNQALERGSLGRIGNFRAGLAVGIRRQQAERKQEKEDQRSMHGFILPEAGSESDECVSEVPKR